MMFIRDLLNELDSHDFDYTFYGNSNSHLIENVSIFPPGKANSLSMWRKSALPDLNNAPHTSNLVICLHDSAIGLFELGFTTIGCDDPRAAFAVLADVLKQEITKYPTKNMISDSVTLGHNTVVNCSVIGSFTTIGHNVVIHEGTIIGRDVEIGDNCSIGGVGFGYVTLPNGKTFRIPHLGNVVIEDGVHIGSNTCIDRGTIGSTTIGARSRIDNLVHIAHNVQIGSDVFVVAGAEVSGSVKVGNGAWIAPNVSIREGITIGERAIVGLGSVVVKDVASETTVMGVPAKTREA